MVEDVCPACGHLNASDDASTTLLRCRGCGVKFFGENASSLEVTLDEGTDLERVDAVLSLDPAFTARYRMQRLLGSGGMGMVVLADDRETGKTVAIKFLRRMGDHQATERFLREARVLTGVAHPHVVEVHALVRIGDHPVLVMEHLSGGTLRELLARRGRLPPAEAVGVVLQVIEGLSTFHERGVVHRDLKPENILFTADGQAKLADLGIAKDYGDAGLTATGQVIGTPIYMSPEQARGDACGIAADIYALGCMLFELLAGRPPFDAKNPMELMRAHADLEPPSIGTLGLSLPPRLTALVHRALAKRIVERPPTCEDLALRLRRALDLPSGPVLAESPSQAALPARAFAPPDLAAGPAPVTAATPALAPAPASAMPDTAIHAAVPALHAWIGAIGDRTLPLGPEPLFVGRTGGPAEIAVDDEGVSFRHVLFVPDGDDLTLIDFKSTNGVSVNGRPVGAAAAKDGDVVTLGNTRIELRRAPPPPPADDPVAALLPPDLLDGWLNVGGRLGDRLDALLPALTALWKLERAIVLTRHAGTGVLGVEARHPGDQTWSPAALDDAQVDAAVAAAGPIVTGRNVLVALRAGGETRGLLYLVTTSDTPTPVLDPAGPLLPALAPLIALSLEAGHAPEREGVIAPWRV